MRIPFTAFLALASLASAASAEPVLMISIDGLRPADVIEAEARGLKVPNLRRFIALGTYATGVVGVLPTVTYPSHTTLITGASPARHGITHNLAFDPLQMNQGGWMWYAPDIKVPTLWEAAAKAGLKVANVHWPVSVAPRGVTWNLPQIWRTGHDDDAKLLTALATPDFVQDLEKIAGESYPQGIDESVEGDERRGRMAQALIRQYRPGFITVYLAGLDHQQHDDGPDTPTSRAVLERLDAVVGGLVATQQKTHRDAVVAVVSDHGFRRIERETNLFHALIDEGLIKLGPDGKIAAWEAMVNDEGGSAAIVLARPDDSRLTLRVAGLLNRLKADPDNGIASIATKGEIDQIGGNPRASFYVGFAPGTASGDFNPTAPLRGTPHSKGTHGYMPSDPAMQSTFMLMGKGVPQGRSLGVIDMREIAPTLARIMGGKLETAEKPPIKF